MGCMPVGPTAYVPAESVALAVDALLARRCRVVAATGGAADGHGLLSGVHARRIHTRRPRGRGDQTNY